MAFLIHRSPSVGSLTKQILAINPDLNTAEIIGIIKDCTLRQGGPGNEFGPAETIDQPRALGLARATLKRPQPQSASN
jgi:hypothetical protein